MKEDDTANENAFDEARDLFAQMSDEARRRAELGREAGRNEARRRSPLVKVLLAVTIVACLAAAVTFGYGLYAFPDAPLRKSYAGFANKQGLPRSEEDFRKFKIWEKVLFTSFGAALLGAFSFAALNARERRRQKL
ncbi:MAG TPA: hypothetical protein VIL74_11300 [Pyrinomonadaceae bacterium]|jgi:uncharacterized membrane protein